MKSNVDIDNSDPVDAYSSLTRLHEVNSYQDSRLPKKIEFNVEQQRHLHQNFSITRKLPLSETPTDSKCELIKTSSPKVKKILGQSDFMRKLSDSQKNNDIKLKNEALRRSEKKNSKKKLSQNKIKDTKEADEEKLKPELMMMFEKMKDKKFKKNESSDSDFQPKFAPNVKKKCLVANVPPIADPKSVPKEGSIFPSVRRLDLTSCDRPSPGKRKARDFQDLINIFELGIQQTPKKRRGNSPEN